MAIRWVALFLCCIVVRSEIVHLENRAIDETGKTLDLAKSGLMRLKNYFVNSSAITHVKLMENSISEIEGKAFKGLPNMVHLNLSQNRIPFRGLDFVYQSAVETLILDKGLAYSGWANDNRILFSKLTTFPKLKKLYLRGNHIDSILLGSALLGEIMPNITHLYLNENSITSSNFLNNIPLTLTHLYLDNNKLPNLQSYHKNNVKVLKIDKNNLLRLSDTNATTYEGARLKNFVQLEELSISNAGLINISLHAFDDLGNLRYLNLSSNKISTFLSDTFGSLKNLVTLDLDNNLLKNGPNICSLKKLEVLSLSFNQISSLGPSSFCGISSLKNVNLSNNALKTVNSYSFYDMLSLEKLDLSKNLLVSLPQNWLPPKINLQYLYVNNNKFVQFSDLPLDWAKNLKYVNIEHNQIKFIHVKSLKSLPENATVEMA